MHFIIENCVEQYHFRKKSIFKKFRGAETPEAEMSFLDHLEVLRWHIVRSAIVLVLVAVVIFFKIDWVFDHIIYVPQSIFPCWAEQ